MRARIRLASLPVPSRAAATVSRKSRSKTLFPAFRASSFSRRTSSGHASMNVLTASTLSASMSSSPNTGTQAGKSIGLTIRASTPSRAALGAAGTRGSRSRQYASLPCRGTSTRTSLARERTGCMGAATAYRFSAAEISLLNLALRHVSDRGGRPAARHLRELAARSAERLLVWQQLPVAATDDSFDSGPGGFRGPEGVTEHRHRRRAWYWRRAGHDRASTGGRLVGSSEYSLRAPAADHGRRDTPHHPRPLSSDGGEQLPRDRHRIRHHPVF